MRKKSTFLFLLCHVFLPPTVSKSPMYLPKNFMCPHLLTIVSSLSSSFFLSVPMSPPIITYHHLHNSSSIYLPFQPVSPECHLYLLHCTVILLFHLCPQVRPSTSATLQSSKITTATSLAGGAEIFIFLRSVRAEARYLGVSANCPVHFDRWRRVVNYVFFIFFSFLRGRR